MLGLIRNHLNGVDVERLYLSQLREHLDRHTLPALRAGYDPGAGPRTAGAQRRVASLRR